MLPLHGNFCAAEGRKKALTPAARRRLARAAGESSTASTVSLAVTDTRPPESLFCPFLKAEARKVLLTCLSLCFTPDKYNALFFSCEQGGQGWVQNVAALPGAWRDGLP